ncbi:hypothetical protein F0267_28465 [Vibrio coralliilyticus]|nr:hypothetical protein [Vibrio coralliilyticus]
MLGQKTCLNFMKLKRLSNLKLQALEESWRIQSMSYNKAFKSDSQRLAFSLRSSIAKRHSHLNAALCLMIRITKNGSHNRPVGS